MDDRHHNYLDFPCCTMFFCFGLALKVPVAVVLLVVMDTSIEKLKEHRG